jgi:hypothetical protein
MSEVKALYPIGKTQWRKWNDAQRTAFNEARAEGVPFADAVAGANQTVAEKKKDVFDVIEDVAEVVATVAPAITAARTVVRAVKGKKGK